jgi:hypothetical protein
MHENNPHNKLPPENPGRLPRWSWFLAIFCLFVILVGRLRDQQDDGPTRESRATEGGTSSETANAPRSGGPRWQPHPAPLVRTLTADEIVATKLKQFADGRRRIAHAMAKRKGVEVSADVDRFFDAVEAWRWDEMQALFDAMRARREQQPPARDLDAIWSSIHETLGVAQETRKWPAQKLLDYGNAVLDSLRPEMVYVGGTDPGRFIPTLLNETSSGEHRVVLSQNPLADNTYLDYLGFLYGDRFSTLTRDDSARAFENYVSDAQQRLEHDQQFPDEPRQIRPGENIRIIDGKIEFSGDVAWMAINEQLLRTLMEKNPDASFAIEQSYPFTSMYADTRPLGPIMELRVQDEQNALTHEHAAQSADYWRALARQLLADPEAPAALNTRMAYAKMASEQAALLDYHRHPAEAEQAYRSASEMWPGCPEAVFRLTDLLIGQNRLDEAFPVAETALAADPLNRRFRDLVYDLTRLRQGR